MSNSEAKIPSHWPLSVLSSLCAALNLILPLLLVRLLSVEEVGIFKIFFLYLSFVPALTLSFGLYNGLAYWSGRAEQGREQVGQSGLLLLSSGLIAAVMAMLFTPQLAALLGLSEYQSIIFALAIFSSISARYFEELCAFEGKVWNAAFFHSAFEILRTVLVVIVALYSRNLEAVLIAHTVVQSFKSLYSFLLAYRNGWLAMRFTFTAQRSLWRYAFPVSLGAILSMILAYGDQYVLSSFLSKREFAIYAIGCLVLPPLMILEHSVTKILIPRLTEALDGGDTLRAAELHRNAVGQLAFLLFPASCGLVVFADPIITLLFTAQYQDAAIFLRVFAVSYLFLAFPYDVVPRARAEGAWILRTFSFFGLLALLLCYLGASLSGALMALCCALAVRGSLRIYGVLYAKQSLQRSWHELLPLRELQAFFVSALFLSTLSLAARPLFESANVWFVICGSIFFFAYFLILLVVKLPKNSSNETRVLMVTQQLEMGGLERMVLELCRQLRGRATVFAFTFDHKGTSGEGNLVPEFERLGVRCEAMKKGRGFSLLALVRLLRCIADKEISVMHSHDLGALIYASLAKVLSPQKVKLVHTQHSFVHLERKARYRLYERLFSMFVDELCVVSAEGGQQYAELGIAPSRITHIPNGIALQGEFSPRDLNAARREILSMDILSIKARQVLSQSASQKWFLHLARLDPVKGQMRTLEIWQKYRAVSKEESILLFVGPEAVAGQENELKEFIQKNGMEGEVLLIGASARPNTWIAAATAVISSSSFEGHPLVPLEAMTIGVPVLASDIPAHKELREHLHLFRDNQEAAEHMSALGVEKQFASRALENWAYVAENFSSEQMMLRYYELYDQQDDSSREISSELEYAHG